MAREILIVDDDPDVREVMERWLTGQGFAVRVTENGDEAMQILNRTDHPGVVLLDLDMPRLNGLEVLRRIMARNIQVAVFVVSGHFDEHAFDVARKLGAKGCLHKPVDFDSLEEVLADHFGSDGGGGAAA